MNHRLFLCPSSQQWEALFIVFRSQLSPSEASSHASYSPSSMYMFHLHGAKITTPASYLIRGAAERLSSGLVYFGTNWKAALSFQWRLSQNSVHRAEWHKSEGKKTTKKPPNTNPVSHLLKKLGHLTHKAGVGLHLTLVSVGQEEVPQQWGVSQSLDNAVHKACVAQVYQTPQTWDRHTDTHRERELTHAPSEYLDCIVYFSP